MAFALSEEGVGSQIVLAACCSLPFPLRLGDFATFVLHNELICI